jgi:hypothetical protein
MSGHIPKTSTSSSNKPGTTSPQDYCGQHLSPPFGMNTMTCGKLGTRLFMAKTIKPDKLHSHHKLAIELCHLHTQQDHEEMESYLAHNNVYHIKNWIHIWKPVIINSV